MATRLDANDPGFEAAFQALLETKRETGAEVDDVVRRILEDVRLKGDEAVIATTREFDGFELTAETMAVTADEIEAAKAASDKDVIGALELAAGRIADFALGAFEAFKRNHGELGEDKAREEFVAFIGAAINQGISEARGILEALSALNPEVGSKIDTISAFIQQRLDDFLANGQ